MGRPNLKIKGKKTDVIVRAVEESAKLQTDLTKELFEDQDVTTVPARSSNDTVRAQLAMTLLKIIELVWTQELL